MNRFTYWTNSIAFAGMMLGVIGTFGAGSTIVLALCIGWLAPEVGRLLSQR